MSNTESRFPVLDYARDDEFNGNGRQVLRETTIEPAVAETGEWIALPVRSIVDCNNGPGFEVGPYTLTEGDVAGLANALIDHVRRYPSVFPQVSGAA